MNEPNPNLDFPPLRPECAPAQEALQRLLDGDTAWDSPEAAQHRDECPACRDDMALARELVGTAPCLSAAAVVPAALGPRIFHASVVDRRRRRLVRWMGAGSVLTASFALLFLLRPPVEQSIRTERTTSPLAAAVPAKPLKTAVSEAREAMLALTMRTATDTRDTSVRLLPPLPDAPEPMNVNLDEPLADAQAGARKSVQPLAVSAKRAMNLFLKTDLPTQPKAN